MSIRKIALGTVEKDRTGTDLRTGGSYINDNFSELYTRANRMLDLTAFIVNDEDDMYAHSSQVVINRCDNKALLFVLYASDKEDWNESLLTHLHNYLKIYELTTMTLLKTFDLFYAGLVADLTLPSAGEARMRVIGTTLYCYISSVGEMYYRTIDISTSDAASWTAGNLVKMQAYMKDSGGNNVLVNINSANIQTHLEYLFGTTDTDFEGLYPLLRNFDKPAVYGGVLYSMFEFNGEAKGSASIQSLITSDDDGITWTFGAVVGYTLINKYTMYEASCVFSGTVLHVIARSGSDNIFHLSSNDFGATFTGYNVLGLTTKASKPTAINVYNGDGSIGIIMAVQMLSEFPLSTHRTTIGIFSTSDFILFTELSKIITPTYAHYPSLFYFSRGLWMSYTKGMKFINDGLNEYNYDRNTIALVRIY